MKCTLRRMMLLFALLVFLAGCVPGTEGNGVLFQDDFSDSTSGWSTLRKDNQVMDYEEGTFRFVVGQPQFDYWSTPRLRFTDAHIEVDAIKVSGGDDNDFGIICRYQDQDNFYGFLISSDGYYGISQRKNKDHRIISPEGKMLYSEDVIHKGAASNRIGADCIGNKLALYVNGKKLVEVENSDFAAGDVGLIAGTLDAPAVEIRFDNFRVTPP